MAALFHNHRKHNLYIGAFLASILNIVQPETHLGLSHSQTKKAVATIFLTSLAKLSFT